MAEALRSPRAFAALGECMIELSGRPLERRYGGDTLNVALYLARLCADVGVRYLTALGADSLSEEMLRAWRAEGILTDRVARIADRQPGLYLIENDAQGERRFFYWRSDSAARHFFSSPVDWPALLADLDWLHLSGITLALCSPENRKRLFRAIAKFRQRGGRISFDNNYRAALWTAREAKDAYQAMLPLTDVALLGVEDERAVWGQGDADDIIARARESGCVEIVVKQGGAPAAALAESTRTEVAPEPVSDVVDTSAAGDAFDAAYLAARFTGAAPHAALRAGHRLSAAVIRHPGAVLAPSFMPSFSTLLSANAL